MSDETQSIVSQITDLKQKQDALMATAREEREELLSRLAGLCHLLGPLTREQMPDGVLKRNRARKAAKVVKTKKAKGEDAA
jgi:hypothetical protein